MVPQRAGQLDAVPPLLLFNGDPSLLIPTTGVRPFYGPGRGSATAGAAKIAHDRRPAAIEIGQEVEG